jgi:cytochrome P450
MMDLPLEDREWLISRTEIMTRSPDDQARMAVVQEIFGYLGGWVQKRVAQPGEDLISQILKVKIGDRPIGPQEVLSECALVLFGGLDTVAGTMAFFARYLATHPDHLRELVEDPTLIPKAVDELIRRHPLPTIARQLTEDVTLGGITMKKGDYVMLSTFLHGLDERAWPEPLKVDFHRDTREMMSFGKGNHKCPGANLARAELRIFLEEWLKRIPRFSLAEGRQSPTLSGAVAGVVELPLVWPV